MLRASSGFVVALTLCAACRSEERPPWRPGVTYATARATTSRGLLDRRGLIHAHSVYSHDACDNEPVKDGQRDPVCFEDFRRGLCESKHDFVMLTDHRESFTTTEFPDTLLYRPERGDRLVERGGAPVASFAACPGADAPLILAGAEAGLMPVGLESHAAPTDGERDTLYGDRSLAAAERLRERGAVILLAHPEDFSIDELAALPLDGFEMYNLHANTLLRAGNVLEFVVRLDRGDQNLPDPNLLLLGLFEEDERYLERWGTVLARGARRVTTVGTDCHRNTFPMPAQDGERIDSYRRMMIWFSNHLLVRPEADGSWDDRHLKEALRAGRLYGAFEVLGYPVGFDLHAEHGGAGGVAELGQEVSLASGVTLVAAMPSVEGLDPAVVAPELTLRILRAIEGGFEEVARGTEASLRYTPDRPGAYRAEVRMVPRHLAALLGDTAPAALARDFVWIYSSALYVTP